MFRTAVMVLLLVGYDVPSLAPPGADHCEAVILTIRHSIAPAWTAEAHLDMDGRWFVPDWDALARVHEITSMPHATPGQAECLAQWLLDHRGGPYFTDRPNFTCPASLEFPPHDDPAVRACSPPVRCEIGDTCV